MITLADMAFLCQITIILTKAKFLENLFKDRSSSLFDDANIIFLLVSLIDSKTPLVNFFFWIHVILMLLDLFGLLIMTRTLHPGAFAMEHLVRPCSPSRSPNALKVKICLRFRDPTPSHVKRPRNGSRYARRDCKANYQF